MPSYWTALFGGKLEPIAGELDSQTQFLYGISCE
jgi:hypothetical protein